MIERKSPRNLPVTRAVELQASYFGLLTSNFLLYEALAARRGAAVATGRGAALTTTFARAAVRAFVVKQRSSALSTLPSMAAAVSRITSDTSEMMRNLARSSMRFSRNERLLDLARKVRLLSTSATS